MITPLDIQNKEFSRGVRGYKEEEVDEFLDLITVDMEKLLSENAALKEQINAQDVDLAKYRGTEDRVLETLESAKKLMGDISASAEKRAEILLKNAELDAELIAREAKENVERLTEENLNLQRRFADFKGRYRSLLESELERFETLSSEIYSQYGMEDLNDLVAPTKKHEAATRTMDRTVQVTEPEDIAKTMINFKPVKND